MLGLGHGGGYHPDVVDPNANFKPNYLSIMNYMYMSGDVPRNAWEFRYMYYYWQYRYRQNDPDSSLSDQFYSYISDEEGALDQPESMVDSHNYAFSSGDGLPLDESDLDETQGLPGYFDCEIDWNGNGVIERSVEFDITRTNGSACSMTMMTRCIFGAISYPTTTWNRVVSVRTGSKRSTAADRPRRLLPSGKRPQWRGRLHSNQVPLHASGISTTARNASK
jgi:hypothetical protein